MFRRTASATGSYARVLLLLLIASTRDLSIARAR